MQSRSHPGDSTEDASYSTRLKLAQGIAYALALVLVLPIELARLFPLPDDEWADPATEPGSWWTGMNVDTTPFFLLLLIAPLCWKIRRLPVLWPGSWKERWNSTLGEDTRPTSRASEWAGRLPWGLALFVGGVSLMVSVGIAHLDIGPPGTTNGTSTRFGDLPPAYHDEYSYLFQAETFLAGRFSFPSHSDAPELFDQMHVLNEGTFASRYFPATGLWIAPFLKWGHPLWGHWLAGALISIFIFWSGRELGGNGIGLLAGLLTALSPGMGLFSNLLLAHHPGLVGLSLFLFAFLRMQRTQRDTEALWAGLGLTWGMLARPMTAAGFGLPFGLWFAAWLIQGFRAHARHTPKHSEDNRETAPADTSHSLPRSLDEVPFRRRIRLAVALGSPLLIGFLVLFGYNRAITGSGFVTPYQLYTETYTPRHVYGFNNVVRGEQRLGPKVIDHYDRWAENLTIAGALENVRHRLLASWQWTLGIVPLLMGGVLLIVPLLRSESHISSKKALMTPSRFSSVLGWRLVLAAIFTLHLVHVPYWYAGIMNWHYVFETGPLWLLLFAGATGLMLNHWHDDRRPALPLWWGGLILVSILPTYVSCEPLWAPSRIRLAAENIAFSRLKYAEFQRVLDERVAERPALVLVEPDPTDLHIDYVVNSPDLTGEILLGRNRPQLQSASEHRHEPVELHRIASKFPDRSLYLFRATTGEIRKIRSIER